MKKPFTFVASFNQTTHNMKKVFLFFFLAFFIALTHAQNRVYDISIPVDNNKVKVGMEAKRGAIAFALSFISGASHGTRETLKNHYGYIANKYPDLNPDVWNPNKSWLLKYNDRDPAKGRNKTPIWFTDPYHALASINQVAAFGAGVTIAIGGKRKFKYYLLQAGISTLGYVAGNTVTYKRNIFVFK